MATAAPGRTLAEVERAITKEVAGLIERGPDRRGEMDRCLAQAESHFIFRLQTIGGFGGKSDQLNAYNIFLGEPGLLSARSARYRSATAASLQHAAARTLLPRQRVVLSVVPRGRLGLALEASKPVVGIVMAADRTQLPVSGPNARSGFQRSCAVRCRTG